jgi:signal recognition particle subunit SRP54
VACDIYRPAAIQQLYVVGDSIGVEVYSEPENKNPVEIAQNAINTLRKKVSILLLLIRLDVWQLILK